MMGEASRRDSWLRCKCMGSKSKVHKATSLTEMIPTISLTYILWSAGGSMLPSCAGSANRFPPRQYHLYYSDASAASSFMHQMISMGDNMG